MPEAIPLRPDVSLVPLGIDCAERMLRWMSDPDVAANVGLRTEPSLQRTRDWIVKASEDPSIQPYAILLKGTHVGNVVLDLIDTYLAKARFSIYIGEPSARGGGVGASAAALILATAFRELKLYKVWLTVHARNAPAIRSYMRLGFQLEGVLRGEFLLDGGRLPALYMSILADEFVLPEAPRS